MTATQEKSSPKKGKKQDDKTKEEKINEIIADGGTMVKMEVDHSATCDEKLPVAESLADSGKLDEALEMLLSLEKQTRTGADTHSTSRVLVLIVKLCAKAGEWSMLNEKILELTKKRSQLKAAVAKMVAECCTFLDNTPDKPTLLKLIDTLRTVTAGKIYVENERARLTHRLSQIKEADGEIKEAAKIMHELQVETYGSMERKEKVELILEQMRLCLATEDYIRTQIISKKISTKFFDDSKHDELRLKFYNYMIQLGLHDQDYLTICKNYRAVYDTKSIQEDEAKKLMAMKNVVLFVILAKHDNEQSDLLHRINLEKKNLQDLPRYKEMLERFITSELINQSVFCQQFEKEVKEGVEGSTPTEVFTNDEAGQARWKDLFSRIVEHNIRIMAKYYTRISLVRMAELLALPESKAEDCLSDMVVSGAVTAKTDRLEGIIDFSQVQDPLENLNDWSSNTNKLMDLVMKTTHLINKEEMVNKHMLAGPQTD